jgi:hypothetical protein
MGRFWNAIRQCDLLIHVLPRAGVSKPLRYSCVPADHQRLAAFENAGTSLHHDSLLLSVRNPFGFYSFDGAGRR